MSFGICRRFTLLGSILPRLYSFSFHRFATFTVAEPCEPLALVIFLVVAAISLALAGRVRECEFQRAACAPCETLASLRGDCPLTTTLDAVAEGAASKIHASLCPVVLLTHGDDLFYDGVATGRIAWMLQQ